MKLRWTVLSEFYVTDHPRLTRNNLYWYLISLYSVHSLCFVFFRNLVLSVKLLIRNLFRGRLQKITNCRRLFILWPSSISFSNYYVLCFLVFSWTLWCRSRGNPKIGERERPRWCGGSWGCGVSNPSEDRFWTPRSVGPKLRVETVPSRDTRTRSQNRKVRNHEYRYFTLIRWTIPTTFSIHPIIYTSVSFMSYFTVDNEMIERFRRLLSISFFFCLTFLSFISLSLRISVDFQTIQCCYKSVTSVRPTDRPDPNLPNFGVDQLFNTDSEDETENLIIWCLLGVLHLEC